MSNYFREYCTNCTAEKIEVYCDFCEDNTECSCKNKHKIKYCNCDFCKMESLDKIDITFKDDTEVSQINTLCCCSCEGCKEDRKDSCCTHKRRRRCSTCSGKGYDCEYNDCTCKLETCFICHGNSQ